MGVLKRGLFLLSVSDYTTGHIKVKREIYNREDLSLLRFFVGVVKYKVENRIKPKNLGGFVNAKAT